jgi:hypothetical protein
LQAGQSNELIIDDFEDAIKTGHRKDSFGCGSYITENKPVAAVRQQLAQFQQLR